MPLFLAVLAGFVAVAILARRTERSWLAPAVVWPLAWSANATAAAAFGYPSAQLVPALLWLLLSCCVFLTGGVLVRGIEPRVPVRAPVPDPFPLLRTIVGLLSLAGLAGLAVALNQGGFALTDIVSFGNLARIAAASRASFTFGEQESSFVARLLLVIAYAGPPFGGLCFRLARGWRASALGLLPLVLITLIGVVYGSRMGVLFGGSLWLGAYLAARILHSSGSPDSGGRVLVAGGVTALLIMAGLSAGVQFIRYSLGNQKAASLIIADPFGFLPAFAEWFNGAVLSQSALTGGFYTFERFARMAGYSLPAVSTVDVGFTTSNIYTVMRGLLEDFGPLGSLSLTGAAGAVATLAFQRTRAGHSPWVATLALIYAFQLSGLALSLFQYTAPMLGALTFAAFIGAAARPPGALGALLRPLATVRDG